MNHLKNEISPYLLAHANNPVDWYPWNEYALGLAQTSGKPIFLSIGYSACHWCHVMEDESFNDPAVAEFLNQHFISIKVDREERPDLDKIYMDALVAMTGSGGWPMSVFLTPDLVPFSAGTYFPPKSRFNLPGFLDLLERIQYAWSQDFDKITQYTDDVKKAISKNLVLNQQDQPNYPSLIEKGIANRFRYMDSNHGGWGDHPKFPHPLDLLFLLDQRVKLSSDQMQALQFSLDSMIQGGFYDVLRGGFHRYSTDSQWLVPHFEKMLYDNALLSKVYLIAGFTLQQESYLQIARDTLDFMLAEMQDSEGGFYSSLDADSEGQEGAFYMWDYQELKNLLTPDLWNELLQTFDIMQMGNFEGQIILRLKNRNIPDRLRTIMLARQNARMRPATDDKVLTDWNGLAISTFAIAGRAFSNRIYLQAAIDAAEFIDEKLWQNDQLHHAYRDGQVRSAAFLSDYSAMVNAMIDLFLATQDGKWLTRANQWAEKMIALFWNDSQFFDTRKDASSLIIRPTTLEDSVIPSGWSGAIQAIQRIQILLETNVHQNIVDRSIQAASDFIENGLLSNGNWLRTLLGEIYPADTIVLIYPTVENPTTEKMKEIIRLTSHPEGTYFCLPENHPLISQVPILHEKNLSKDQPTVYICKGTQCSQPITTIDELEKSLSSQF